MATISIFVGSVREGRQGINVVRWIEQQLINRKHTVHVIDPSEIPELITLKLPNHYNKSPTPAMKRTSDLLRQSDGFILISPEYNHSFSGVIKNALDNFMPEYEKKPFGIVTYSIGPFGGIRANEALRPVVSELKGVPTPIPLIISNVEETFKNGKLTDKSYDERFTKFIENFEWYVNALAAARK